MAYAMTKQGSLDNCITYEFMCDTVADMNAIENRYRTIGTVAIVLSGESGMEVYIAGSNKQWNSLSSIGGSNAGGNTAGLVIHICTQNEVSNGLPDVELPDETTIYLVPASDASSGNLYDEYIYVDDEWEKFGSSGTTIDLSTYALKADPIFTGSISMGRAANSTIGTNSIAIGENVTASNDQAYAEGCDTIASGQYSHAEGIGGTYTINNTTYTSEAKGTSDHTEGFRTRTSAGQPGNHAEGYQTSAIGGASHAEGSGTTASGNSSHAEGSTTTASAYVSHAEGSNTTASGSFAHAEGSTTTASAQASHAEGNNTTASGVYAHAEGSTTTASDYEAHAEGYKTTASPEAAHAEGNQTTASGDFSHAEGLYTQATQNYTHAEGLGSEATNGSAHAEGINTKASGEASHAEGTGGGYTRNNVTYVSGALGSADHTEGYQTRTAAATYDGNHAEGYQTAALGGAAHAEGYATTASGQYCHAEGSYTTASGDAAHAEGNNTIASYYAAHAEGSNTTASGSCAHAEGLNTTASGIMSHAEGNGTVASGALSHTEGMGTIANIVAMHASGWYNAIYPAWISGTNYKVNDLIVYDSELFKCKTANSDTTFDSSKWLNQSNIIPIFVIGNGSLNNSRSNACTINKAGNEYLMGDIYVGCNADSTGGTKLPRIPDPPTTDGVYTLQATVSNGTVTYSWIAGA